MSRYAARTRVPMFDFNLWKVYRPTRPTGNWFLVFRDGDAMMRANRPKSILGQIEDQRPK